MSKREKLLQELQGEQSVGVLLMVQMDSVPETLQFVVATTLIDEDAGGLRDVGKYVVRAIGVKEHQVSVGLFQSLQIRDEHPLLHQYNTTPSAVFFRGKPTDPNRLFIDIMQAYASTFGPWRQIPQYLNQSKPLFNLLASDGDLLGEMPEPLADNIIKTLESHDIEYKRVVGEKIDPTDEHDRSRLRKVMLIDDSYIVALDFTVEELGRV